MSPNGPVVGVSGQDVDVAAFKLLANQLHIALHPRSRLDSGGQLVLQLGELSDLPSERHPRAIRSLRTRPLFMTVAMAVAGSLRIGEAAREPTARLPAVLARLHRWRDVPLPGPST